MDYSVWTERTYVTIEEKEEETIPNAIIHPSALVQFSSDKQESGKRSAADLEDQGHAKIWRANHEVHEGWVLPVNLPDDDDPELQK